MNKVQLSVKKLRRHFRLNGNILFFYSAAAGTKRKGMRFRLTQTICALLVLSFLSTSISAEPRAIIVGAQEFSRSVRFGFFSNGWDVMLNDWSGSLLLFLSGTGKGKKAQETPAVNRIGLLPGGDIKIRQGEPLNFSAIGYAADGTPVGGLKFSYTVEDIGRKLKPHNLPEGVFTAQAQGNFLVTAEANAVKATTTVEVQANDVLITLKRIKQYEARGNTAAAAKLKALGTYTSETISSKSLPKRLLNAAQNNESAQATDEHIKKGGPSADENEPAENAAAHRTKMMMRPPDDQGWGDNNWQTADDPGNQTGTPPGTSPDMAAGNGNFQFSAPVVALPGRGIDVNLALSYNSRLWSKAGNQMSYDSDRGYPAPGWELGFGKMMFMGTSGGCMLVDADGTRHGYDGTLSNYSSGSYHSTSFGGHTTDGKFIDYSCYYSSNPYGTSVSGTAQLPDGTTVSYFSSTANGEQAFPTQITDAQGNYINVSYVNNHGPEINTITDTMGRVTTFNYDSSNRLISVAVPKFNNAGTRIAVQLHYKQINLNPGFAYPLTVDTANPSPSVIDSIYYPGTNTGYWFNDSDSYSSYGMIAKVIEQRGMGWSGAAGTQGTVTPGTMSKQAVYNYTPTPDYTLTDAPTYTTLTESWDGINPTPSANCDNSNTASSVTCYEIHNNSTPRTVTVTQPNGVKSKQTSFNHPGVWDDGLIYQDETLDSSNNQLSKSIVAWAQGAYGSARPAQTEITDERGQVLKTTYAYGANYNQLISKKEYDYDGATILKDTQNSYENNSSYINRHVLNLVKTTEIYDGANNRAARTDYEYDNNAVVSGTQNHNLTATPGVTMHNATSDPYTTETRDGFCTSGSYNYSQCTYDGEELYLGGDGGHEGYFATCYYQCYEYEQISAYDSNSIFRGNVTKTTDYGDAANLAGAISRTKQYDDTGNLVAESAACCDLKNYVYDDPNTTQIDTQYAYPVMQTRGSSDPNSTIRNASRAVYDFNTGLIKQTTDANGRTDSTTYNADTLRPTAATSSTGAYTTSVYDDAAMSIVNETHESGGNLASKNTKYLNGIGKLKREDALGANNISDTVETQYTKMGQVWKKSRPYRSGTAIVWTIVDYDLLGRTSQVTDPDGSVSKVFYNEASRPVSASNLPGSTIRNRDAWGRERWTRNDAWGRTAEVVEPNPNGDGTFSATGNLATNYAYDTLGQVTQTDQGGQLRKFRYDSLGRMTRQKLAEQTATINDAGQYVGAGAAGANWSGAVAYDERSNIVQKVDPRGVKINYSYQLNGGDDSLNRIQGISYDLSGTHDTSKPIAVPGAVSYEYMNAGDQSRIKKIRTAGILTEDFTYDGEGRVGGYTQTVDYRTSYPWATNYAYDTLGRVTDVTYPAQYGMTGSPRKVVHNVYDVASRLTGLQVNGQDAASSIVYNAADQTTSIKVGASGTNQITENYAFDSLSGLMTSQQAIKGGTALLDLSYDYTRNNSAGNTNAAWKTGALTKIINNSDHGKDREFQYDALGRLTVAKGKATNQWQQQYVYDRYGNRTSVTATGLAADNSAIPRDGLAAVSYDAASNRMTTAGYEYDVAGNQTRALAGDGVTWLKFEYDAANRLQAVRKDDANQTLVQAFQFSSTNARLIDYDPAAGRNTFYLNIGGRTLAEFTEDYQNIQIWKKSYVYLGDRQLATVTPNGAGGEITEYSHPDRLGTRLITNQAAGTSYEQNTLPFGTALGAESTVTGNVGKRFTSYERSAVTGLDYAQNRTYDSKQGRFTQVDPLGMSAASLVNPQSLNLYNYVGNDPVNRTDPTGLFWGAIGRFFKQLIRIIALVVIIAVLVIIAFCCPPLAPGIVGTIITWAFLGVAALTAYKLSSDLVGHLRQWFDRCSVPSFAALSRARQDELAQRGVSSEQWNHLRNNQRLGYFNIVAAIASAGLSLMGWLVDWAAGGIQQDRTFFKAGEGATNLVGQVRSSSSFSPDINGGGSHPGYGDSYRRNSFTRSLQLSFDPINGTRLEADIDIFNPNRQPFGTFLHVASEVFPHYLNRFFGGGSRTNPYNVAYRSSWECK